MKIIIQKDDGSEEIVYEKEDIPLKETKPWKPENGQTQIRRSREGGDRTV